LRNVIEGASNDPKTIAKWEREKPDCALAIRLWSDSIIVIDFERPGKGSEHGGLHTLANIEAEHGPIPRTGPKAQSESGGEHWYFMIPVQFRGLIKNWNHVFPSIDIRVKTGLVVIPPSVGRQWITTFDEAETPELPEWFCRLILADRKIPNEPASRPHKPATITPPATKQHCSFNRAPISKREWCRLQAARDFRALWTRQASVLKDRSNSSYEYWLCRLGFRRGLTAQQVATLILSWWSFHDIDGKKERLLRKTIPNAWRAVREYVEDYQAKQQAKEAGKTVNRILTYLLDHEAASPSELETALNLPHSKVQKALGRMVTKRLIEKIGRAKYRVLVTDETNQNSKHCIGEGQQKTECLYYTKWDFPAITNRSQQCRFKTHAKVTSKPYSQLIEAG
jgi:hypothetical protein